MVFKNRTRFEVYNINYKNYNIEMRKIFVAFAAALLVTAGNAVSLRQFQPRDNNELAPVEDNQNNDNFDQRPFSPQQNGEEQPPKPRKKKGPRPPRRQDGEGNFEQPQPGNEGWNQEGPSNEEVKTFS